MKILCPACKKRKKHYAKGLCGNCYQKAYQKTDKYKAYKKRYNQSPMGGRAARKRHDQKVLEGYRRAKKAGLI